MADESTNGQAAPAVIVRMIAQVGVNRSIEMQFGIPLDMTPKDLNRYMDKVAAAADRQHNKGLLEQAQLNLEGAYRDLETNIANRAHYEASRSAEHSARGKRGEWKPEGSQAAQLRTFDTNDQNIRDNIIPRLKKQIEELEAKINKAE